MAGTKRGAKTKAIKEAFKVWYADKKASGELFKGEVFVPIYDKRTQKEDYRHYVSNCGRIVSFAQNAEKPIFYDLKTKTYTPSKKDDIESSYWMYLGDPVQVVVWWSWMYHAITTGYRPFPAMQLRSKGKNIQFKSKQEFVKAYREKKNNYEIHHNNKMRLDNTLINLICLKADRHHCLHEDLKILHEAETGKEKFVVNGKTYTQMT